ncbi:MAG: DUF4242 domain-containing protein [Chitinophagaceae bacterium]|nr:DUF4242 domain-containing protein [Chitinophagaceae bacterium]
MKVLPVFSIITAVLLLFSSRLSAQTKNYYIDVHHLGAGKVTAAAVADAHAKDLATEKKYGVEFIKYWVDEKDGDVYCLSSAPDTQSIRKTHGEAHGLLPDDIYMVKAGKESPIQEGKDFYLDVHELGAGKVTAKDVAGAHEKDLAVQSKYGVNFINYWVDEKDGRVVCLSQAPDSSAVINTHKEAHGLVPVYIEKVKQGQ